MLRTRIDISEDLDGDVVVYACFELSDEEVAASAHAVAASAGERFRTQSISSDDVLELRDLTGLADELSELARGEPGTRTVVLRPARLSVYHDALTAFVASRDEADWVRDEDREPLSLVRGLLLPLGQLREEAMRAALSPAPRPS